MKRQSITLLCLMSLTGLLAQSAIGAQAPYVLSQTVTHRPVASDSCIQLIRQLNQQEAADSQASQALASQLTTQEAQLSQLQASIQTLAGQLETANGQLQDLENQLDQQIEATYQALSLAEADFAQASEEEQASHVQGQPEIQALVSQIEAQKERVAQTQAQLDQAKQEAASLDYERHTKEDELEQSKASRTELNQCLLYPYSSHNLQPGRLPLNPAAETLADYLIGVNQALNQLVPLAYQKVKYQEIVAFFQPDTSNADEVAQALAGKQELVLSPEGEAYYQYAQELTLFDIEILANLALRQYYQDQDLAVLEGKFQAVYQLKAGQYHYLYALNEESFTALKEGLAAYLNQHHYGPEAAGKLKPLIARYQLHLVAYETESQTWQPVGRDQEPFLTAPALTQASAGEEPAAAASEAPEEVGEPTPHRGNRRVRPETRTESSSESAQTPDSSSESSSVSPDPEALKRLKARLNKRQHRHQADTQTRKAKRSKVPDASTPSANGSSSVADVNSRQDGSVKLPDTGEQAFYMALAAALAGLGGLVLVLYLYRRYRQKQALKKIHFD